MGSYKDDMAKWFHKSSFQDLKVQMDSFFDDTFHEFFKHKPFRVHMYETESNVVIKAVLPGYKRDQIKLAIIGNQLRITAEGSGLTNEEKKVERLVSLPFTISKGDTKASYQDGILEINTPIRKPNTSFIDIDENNA